MLVRYSLGHRITAFTTSRTEGRNREAIMKALCCDVPFYYPHQTHTDNVMRFSEEMKGIINVGAPEGEGMDAVISNATGVVLGISTADCIPVLIYDSEHHAAAAIHAGWKGTVKRIVEKALEAMRKEYDTDPEQCTAVIGPGISLESFEIGWEVHQQFVDAGFEMADVTITLPARVGEGMKPHIDLKEINRQQLLHMGVREENITVSPIDTFTDKRFFSARREQTGTEKCGRILSGWILNED